MPAELASDRCVLAISGQDSRAFLQGLITNDIEKLRFGMVYAAILSPQGKYLADFFLVEQGEQILLDVAASFAPGLLKRLNMYKLRADVAIEQIDTPVTRGLGETPQGAYQDPRHPALGWRAYGQPGTEPSIDWDQIRVDHMIPETGIELLADDTYILEAGFEGLNSVDFKKGCYVGQEVTARMKHKTELRKGFRTVNISSAVPVGTAILADGKPVGTVFTQSGGKAIAYLRFDRARGNLQAGAASITL